MKYFAILVAVLLVSSFAFANDAFTPTNFFNGEKLMGPNGHPQPGQPVGGDDISTATVIGSLPYYDTGNTCSALNDYEETCPYTGSSPEVVYSFTPTVDMAIKVDLCDSWYDTKVYVYENSVGMLVACNDDFCSGPNYPYSYLSYVENVPVYAGNTYYIVVDGYGAASCGDYVIKVDEFIPPQPCEVVCPADAWVENEPLCGNGYVDATNGGCNSTPPVFQYLECGTDPFYFCGESGEWYDSYTGYYMRDTDWFSFTLTETKTVTLTTCAEFEVLNFLLIPQPDCSYYTYPYSNSAPAYLPCVLTATLGPGEYWYWVGCADFYAGVPCGAKWVASIEGWCAPDATEESSWGAVKEMFR